MCNTTYENACTACVFTSACVYVTVGFNLSGAASSGETEN